MFVGLLKAFTEVSFYLLVKNIDVQWNNTKFPKTDEILVPFSLRWFSRNRTDNRFSFKCHRFLVQVSCYLSVKNRDDAASPPWTDCPTQIIENESEYVQTLPVGCFYYGNLNFEIKKGCFGIRLGAGGLWQYPRYSLIISFQKRFYFSLN